ncbi:hypothetical protein K439DRAFT_1658506 [Ramaria rubella]|nr:hypothetical protein K439DRAFT_1658506 [Ramaria rubella]
MPSSLPSDMYPSWLPKRLPPPVPASTFSTTCATTNVFHKVTNPCPALSALWLMRAHRQLSLHAAASAASTAPCPHTRPALVHHMAPLPCTEPAPVAPPLAHAVHADPLRVASGVCLRTCLYAHSVVLSSQPNERAYLRDAALQLERLLQGWIRRWRGG